MLRVLLADHNPINRKIIALSFDEEGDIEVASFGEGEKAAEDYRKQPADLVLADVSLPGVSGYELCREVKSHPRGAHTPVVLLSGRFEPFNRELAEEVGYHSQLTKPVEPPRLVALVKQLLQESARAREQAQVQPSVLPVTAGNGGPLSPGQLLERTPGMLFEVPLDPNATQVIFPIPLGKCGADLSPLQRDDEPFEQMPALGEAPSPEVEDSQDVAPPESSLPDAEPGLEDEPGLEVSPSLPPDEAIEPEEAAEPAAAAAKSPQEPLGIGEAESELPEPEPELEAVPEDAVELPPAEESPLEEPPVEEPLVEAEAFDEAIASEEPVASDEALAEAAAPQEGDIELPATVEEAPEIEETPTAEEPVEAKELETSPETAEEVLEEAPDQASPESEESPALEFEAQVALEAAQQAAALEDKAADAGSEEDLSSQEEQVAARVMSKLSDRLPDLIRAILMEEKSKL